MLKPQTPPFVAHKTPGFNRNYRNFKQIFQNRFSTNWTVTSGLNQGSAELYPCCKTTCALARGIHIPSAWSLWKKSLVRRKVHCKSWRNSVWSGSLYLQRLELTCVGIFTKYYIYLIYQFPLLYTVFGGRGKKLYHKLAQKSMSPGSSKRSSDPIHLQSKAVSWARPVPVGKCRFNLGLYVETVLGQQKNIVHPFICMRSLWFSTLKYLDHFRFYWWDICKPN